MKPILEAIMSKYGKPGFDLRIDVNADGTYQIKKWVHPDGIDQPGQAEVDTAVSEYEAGVTAGTAAKKSRKRQLLDALATLTGLTRKQVLVSFNEIVRDGNDD